MSKESNNGSNTSGGVGFCGLLAIAFIVLKLCSVISWSWWWVLAPLWIPFAIVISILLVLLVVWGIAAVANTGHKRK